MITWNYICENVITCEVFQKHIFTWFHVKFHAKSCDFPLVKWCVFSVQVMETRGRIEKSLHGLEFRKYAFELSGCLAQFRDDIVILKWFPTIWDVRYMIIGMVQRRNLRHLKWLCQSFTPLCSVLYIAIWVKWFAEDVWWRNATVAFI